MTIYLVKMYGSNCDNELWGHDRLFRKRANALKAFEEELANLRRDYLGDKDVEEEHSDENCYNWFNDEFFTALELYSYNVDD